MGSRGEKKRSPRDPLQVNLRWLVHLILLTVVLPTTVLTGIGLAILWVHEQVSDLLFGLLVVAFAGSMTAGALLLLFLARRGARLAEVQETFVSRMSHEILTPIAGIRLHVQILETMELPGEATDSIQAIRREVDRLQELVGRIMEWRQVRSPRHLYRIRRTRPEEIVAMVRERLSDQRALRVRIVDEFTFRADPDAIAEALANLVQNAIKYAGERLPVELVARRWGRLAVFAVNDEGPGLPPTPLEQLFEPFTRWVARDRPDPGGTGLGLAIARQIVRAHGGRLTATHRRGRGTRFLVTLPTAEGASR